MYIYIYLQILKKFLYMNTYCLSKVNDAGNYSAFNKYKCGDTRTIKFAWFRGFQTKIC